MPHALPHTWDLGPVLVESSTTLKLYLLFLFLVWIFTSINLVRVWRIVAPFSSRQQQANPAYRGFLQTSAASMQHLINLTCLIMGLFASVTVYSISDRLLANEGKILVISFVIRYLSSMLTLGLLVSLYAFLARWHICRRIERFLSPD
jgi:hypothetical protein